MAQSKGRRKKEGSGTELNDCCPMIIREYLVLNSRKIKKCNIFFIQNKYRYTYKNKSYMNMDILIVLFKH